jgi:hypothetical protein
VAVVLLVALILALALTLASEVGHGATGGTLAHTGIAKTSDPYRQLD